MGLFYATGLIKVLYVCQLGINLANVIAGGISIADGWKAKKDDENTFENSCDCVFNPRPPSCSLVINEQKQSLHDELFLVCCGWIVLFSAYAIFQDLRIGSHRLQNSILLAFVGTLWLSIGVHFDRDEFLVYGAISLCFCALILLSIPLFSREIPNPFREQLSGDQDDFQQRGGAFSSLE